MEKGYSFKQFGVNQMTAVENLDKNAIHLLLLQIEKHLKK